MFEQAWAGIRTGKIPVFEVIPSNIGDLRVDLIEFRLYSDKEIYIQKISKKKMAKCLNYTQMVVK